MATSAPRLVFQVNQTSPAMASRIINTRAIRICMTGEDLSKEASRATIEPAATGASPAVSAPEGQPLDQDGQLSQQEQKVCPIIKHSIQTQSGNDQQTKADG